MNDERESWPQVIAAGLVFLFALGAMYACVLMVAASMDVLP